MSLSLPLVREQNAAVMQWIPKVRRKLRGSAAWFQDGKTESFIMRGKGSKSRREEKLVNSIKPSTKQK